MLDILKSLNILYAEDDLDLRDTISRSLSMMCNQVFLAKDGVEALEIYEKEVVHIVILDYVMPFMDGYEVSKEMRKKDKTLPIIISSGHSDKEKLLKAIELHLISYIEKPLSYEKLVKALKQAINSLEENNRLEVNLSENLFYNYINKTIKKNGEFIQLSKQEVTFLELLLTKRNTLFLKQSVEDIVFGVAVDTNTIRNMVYRLRKKLDSDIIATVKDLGYILR